MFYATLISDDETVPTTPQTEDESKRIILRSMAIKFEKTDEKPTKKSSKKAKTNIKTELDSTDSDGVKLEKSDYPLPCSEYAKPMGYECPKCRRIYNARKNLVRHMNLECGRDPQYKCPHCPHGNHRRNELKRHIQKKHSKNTSCSS